MKIRSVAPDNTCGVEALKCPQAKKGPALPVSPSPTNYLHHRMVGNLRRFYHPAIGSTRRHLLSGCMIYFVAVRQGPVETRRLSGRGDGSAVDPAPLDEPLGPRGTGLVASFTWQMTIRAPRINRM